MLAYIKSKQFTSLIIKQNISSYEKYKLTQKMNGCKAWIPQPKERLEGRAPKSMFGCKRKKVTGG
jgi:hypothetical protein